MDGADTCILIKAARKSSAAFIVLLLCAAFIIVLVQCSTQLLGFDPDSLHFVTTCSFPPGSFLGAIQRLFVT
jgi:hypothetical protein